MDTVAIEVTDPSTQLMLLGQRLRNYTIPRGDSPILLQGLAKAIEIDPEASEYIEVLAVIRNRILGLRAFASSLEDSDFGPELKQEVIVVTQSFEQIVKLQNLQHAWDTSRTSYISDTHLTTLRWFGPIARRHRPLRLITEEIRTELLAKIDEAILVVEADSAMAGWQKSPLLDGLARIKLILRYLLFFGHDAAIQELILFGQKATALRAVKTSGTSEPTFWKVAAIISVIGNLLILPDQAYTAVDHYQAWFSQAIQAIPKPPTEQRLLEPPKAPVTEEMDTSR